MKAEPSAAADTRMMGIVHGALRRDLARAAYALLHQPFPGDAQRVAIAQHLQAMMHFLRIHHSGEDAWLWPTMRRLNPGASDVLDQMDADHLAITPHMEEVTAAASAYEKSATGREALVSALSDLRGTLDPHLRRGQRACDDRHHLVLFAAQVWIEGAPQVAEGAHQRFSSGR